MKIEDFLMIQITLARAGGVRIYIKNDALFIKTYGIVYQKQEVLYFKMMNSAEPERKCGGLWCVFFLKNLDFRLKNLDF